MVPTVQPRHTEEELLHWLAFRLTPGLGPKKAAELLARFGSPMAVFRASAAELEMAGLSGTVARSLASGCAFEDAAEQHERLRRTGAQVVTLGGDGYPSLLAEIFDPPVMLFALGRLELLDRVGVAVVGSRRATQYGMAVAERLGAELSGAGVAVVSGMARGIDTAAHLGALGAGGGTIAVFGCGLDVIYPAENRKLAERLAREGLLLSEFPFGAPAHPQNFPVRNRTVSGLCEGVVVVEGEQYSGSMITARLALDQNREVFAVPGNITARMSYAPNLLIKQGATLVQGVSDILDGLSWEARARLSRQGQLDLAATEGGSEEAGGVGGPMAGIAKEVVSLLQVDKTTGIDELLAGMPHRSSSEVIAVLFELELAGRIRQLPGRSYVKVWSE